MKPPIISFVNFNRLGLGARNLEALLKTEEDFELYIIDNNSKDDSWEYIQSLNDPRIKCKKRFDLNRGLIYSLNYVLSKREKDQFFITIDSDVYIETTDWISKFMEAFNNFDDLGLAVAERETYFQEKKIVPKELINNGVRILELNIVIGCCMCIHPKLINELGYFNEETYGADKDICARIIKYTKYKIGVVPTIKINQKQIISCNECICKDMCNLKNITCFRIYSGRYRHVQFSKKVVTNQERFFREILDGKRTAYCASIHDEESMKNHYYDKNQAEENFKFFIDNAN